MFYRQADGSATDTYNVPAATATFVGVTFAVGNSISPTQDLVVANNGPLNFTFGTDWAITANAGGTGLANRMNFCWMTKFETQNFDAAAAVNPNPPAGWTHLVSGSESYDGGGNPFAARITWLSIHYDFQAISVADPAFNEGYTPI